MDRFLVKKEDKSIENEIQLSLSVKEECCGNKSFEIDHGHGENNSDNNTRYKTKLETLPSKNRKRTIEDNDTPSQSLDNKKPRLLLNRKKISGENIDCDYMRLYSRKEADVLLRKCEESLEYFTGDLAKIRVYGKWHNIPRKQVAHGDPGVTYKYSSVTVPAKPWTPLLCDIRDKIQDVTGHKFNFVLINRYADGSDYMGEHRDDEKDLVPTSPIASLSLGQHRDFIFRHCETRGSKAKRQIPSVKVELEHGSLLMMNYPTNVYWYHSLPVRKKAVNTRINMTFRDIVTSKK